MTSSWWLTSLVTGARADATVTYSASTGSSDVIGGSDGTAAAAGVGSSALDGGSSAALGALLSLWDGGGPMTMEAYSTS